MTNLILRSTLFCLIYCSLLEQERWVRFEQERWVRFEQERIDGVA